MKILLTGASSFTGYWFAKELTARGYKVWAAFRNPPGEYLDPLRRKRVEMIAQFCDPVFGLCFGNDRFIDLIKNIRCDVLCHHAADVSNYRSPDFDVVSAVKSNTFRLPLVFSALRDAECSKVVLTGSVFENDEGAGGETREAFSPYGLSKGLTWQVFRYYAQSNQLNLGKFVIPNPFGPYEEPRFIHYLFKNWFTGAKAAVNTPLYVRDNIHISLLAKAYVHFVENLQNGMSRINPSGYVESQGAFAERVAREMMGRLKLSCELELKQQSEFTEPLIRINSDVPNVAALGWSEMAAWDDLADYYLQRARTNGWR